MNLSVAGHFIQKNIKKHILTCLILFTATYTKR